jgi:microcystin-dependent protein
MAAYSNPGGLFEVIGTMYCNGMCGPSGFRVPDMRGYVPVGKKATGVFSTSVGSTAVGGAETVTLTPMQRCIYTFS